MEAIIETDFPTLKLLSKGKVRDIYSTSSPDHLLFVATDRISAYDVILKNGIPDKGKYLTKLSLFWFDKLGDVIPNHLVTAEIDEMPEEVWEYKDQLEGRAMLVRKAEIVPLEAIVRGYLSGSAWSEYKKSRTIHGLEMPDGLVESAQLPKPIFTPSTKADQGEHDENISAERAAELIGKDLFEKISSVALQLYNAAAQHARLRGLILADTKFEFGLVPTSSLPASSAPTITVGDKSLILVDEVLTPDSSRYWPLASYHPGTSQPSFDKQYVRDWLVASGFKKGFENGPEGHEGEGWVLSDAVVKGTQERYSEAVSVITLRDSWD